MGRIIKYKRFIACYLIVLILLSGVTLTPISAADSNTITKTVDIFNDSQKFSSALSKSNVVVDLSASIPAGYQLKSYEVWKDVSNGSGGTNSTNQGHYGATIVNNKLTFSNFNGALVDVVNIGFTSNMYFELTPTSGGRSWDFTTEGTRYRVSPPSNSDCWVNGKALCTDLLTKDIYGNDIPKDEARDANGWGLAISDGFVGPTTYKYGSESVKKADLKENTVDITHAIVAGDSSFIRVVSYGNEKGGNNDAFLTVAAKMTIDNPLGTLNGTALRYSYKTETKWAAKTFLYAGEVRLTLEPIAPPNVPVVTCSCEADPSAVVFASTDVMVTSTLTATVSQQGSKAIKNWTIYGRASDGSQLTTLTSMSPGQESITHQFRFTIPKEKFDSVDSYTETWVLRAKVYFVDGTSAEQGMECTTTAMKEGEPPSPTPTDPAAPTPEPTIEPVYPPIADIEFEPSQIFTGEKSSIVNDSENMDDWTWTFSSNLTSHIVDPDDWVHSDMTFDEPGVYTAEITVSSSEGLTDSDSATLVVVDPKPIAVIAGVQRAIIGRPLEVPYNLNNSYSPMEDRGITVDFSKNEMRYKKTEYSTYIDSWPTNVPSELGTYSIEGLVYDSVGRVSDWDSMILEVVPDQPPTVEIYAPEQGYRGFTQTLFISASSPDDDQLTNLKLEEVYDTDDDGSFADETWKTIYDGVYKESNTVTYTTVGDRQYRATVTEDYGLTGTSNLDQTDILNLAPTADFEVYGLTNQPDQDGDSMPPEISYTPDNIFRSWTLKMPYVGGSTNKVAWKPATNTLSTKNAEKVSYVDYYPNLGKGLTSQSQYDLADNLELLPYWTLTPDTSEAIIDNVFSGNRMVSYFQASGGTLNYTYMGTVRVRDAQTGNIQKEFKVSTVGSSSEMNYLGTDPNEILYFYLSTGKIESYNLEGTLIDSVVVDLGIDDSPFVGVSSAQIFPDGENMYIAYRPNTGSFTFNLAKYSIKQRAVLWKTAIISGTANPDSNYFGASITIDPNTNNALLAVSHRNLASSNADEWKVGLIAVSSSGVILKSDARTAGVTISSPVMSNDGQYIYINELIDISSSSYGGQSLWVYDATTFARVAVYKDSGTTGQREFPNLPNPVVMADGRVYIPATNGYRNPGYFSKEGVLLQSYTEAYDVYPYSGKMFQLSSGEIVGYDVSPTDYGSAVDITSITGSTRAVKKHFTHNAPLHSSFKNNYVTSSNITPEGSLYIIGANVGDYADGVTYIFPVVSAETTNPFPKEKDANTIQVLDDSWGGLFYDPNTIMKNQILEFNVAVTSTTNDKTIGAAINVQDEKNMYSVEWVNDNLTLYKVVDGTKTSMRSIALTRSVGTTYMFKIQVMNGTISVYVNNTKRLEATDSKFTSGSAGIMSLGQPMAAFSSVKRTNYGDMTIEETYQTALVGEEIKYDTLFADTESDVKFAEEWSYVHDPNYFANPLGTSQYNGKTYSSTINALDKPGLYTISYRAQDEPGMAAYRQWSEIVTKELYVHRRPVAQPDVRFTNLVYAEGEALDYSTYDASYDPDVPDYLEERLIRTRWADEPTWTTGERLLYNRPGFELIIQEQVKDIHGAWSFWAEVRVYKDALPPVNQTKPKMVITSPNGTTTSPTLLLTDPIVKWTYSDAENDPQEQFYLKFTYVDTGVTALEVSYPGDDVTYEVESGTFDVGRKMKVQGRVYSKGVWSDDSNIVYYIINTPPVTYLLNFNGLDASTPIYTNSNKPQLKVFTVDAEGHTIKYVDYEVFHMATGASAVDTDTATANAYFTTTALQEGLHYWRARANDSYAWGPYSGNGYFFVDTVKPADVDEQLDIKPTAVTVEFNAFSDPAPSSGHATRTFYLQKVNSDGSVTNIDLNGDGTTEYSTPLALSKQSYTVTGLVTGQEYRLTVIDYDVAGNEGYFEYIYFVTNQPPVADFDWSPKPVWESQHIYLQDKSSDPDGDPLTWSWMIENPEGDLSYSTQQHPVISMALAGTYTVTLNVCDDKGLCANEKAVKTIEVLPVSVTGIVFHTDKWLENLTKFNAAAKKAGRTERPTSYFFPGERFMLRGSTVGPNIVRVDAVMLDANQVVTTYDANLPGSPDTWNSSIWGAEMINWTSQDLYFKFTLTTDTGFKKDSPLVKVRIEDDEYWRQHGIR